MKRYARRSRARGGNIPATLKGKLTKLASVAQMVAPYASAMRSPATRNALIKQAVMAAVGKGRGRGAGPTMNTISNLSKATRLGLAAAKLLKSRARGGIDPRFQGARNQKAMEDAAAAIELQKMAAPHLVRQNPYAPSMFD